MLGLVKVPKRFLVKSPIGKDRLKQCQLPKLDMRSLDGSLWFKPDYVSINDDLRDALS